MGVHPQYGRRLAVLERATVSRETNFKAITTRDLESSICSEQRQVSSSIIDDPCLYEASYGFSIRRDPDDIKIKTNDLFTIQLPIEVEVEVKTSSFWYLGSDIERITRTKVHICTQRT
jgi:hypothetical protein